MPVYQYVFFPPCLLRLSPRLRLGRAQERGRSVKHPSLFSSASHTLLFSPPRYISLSRPLQRHTLDGRPSLVLVCVTPSPAALHSPTPLSSRHQIETAGVYFAHFPQNESRRSQTGKIRFHLASNLTTETCHFTGRRGISLRVLHLVGFSSSCSGASQTSLPLAFSHPVPGLIVLFTPYDKVFT